MMVMASLSVLNILRTIKDRGTVSRTELQQTTGLSWGTITNTTRDLLNRNLIREEGAQSTKAGRKPVRLAINPNSHVLIGVEIGVGVVRCQALNLAGETLDYHELTFEGSESPAAVLDRAGGLIQRVLDLPIMSARGCLGIGVSVPGYLDADRGMLTMAPRLANWRNVGIRKVFQDRFSCTVRMEREANCLALAERWFGEAGQADDVLCVNLGETVGMGILAAGEVFRGSEQMAGEFGHMTVDPSGPACSCGDKGCVEAYASLVAVRELARSMPEKQSSALAGVMKAGNPTVADLMAAATAGDAAAKEAFDRMGRYLGIGIANLVDLFNPGLIVLAGPLALAQDFFLPTLGAEVEKHASVHSNRHLLVSQLGERAVATGACGIVLQSVFEPSQVGASELQQA
jgi:predicted NBD/HSP70 family sugar kinase